MSVGDMRDRSARQRTPDSLVKVVTIVGSGRSGSTILGNVLGEIDGYFHAGELRTLWGQALMRGRLCGCRERVSDCPFWTKVLEAAFGPTGNWPEPAAINRSLRRLVRLRDTRRLLHMVPGESPGSHELNTCAQVLSRLFHGIAQVRGSRVIVDSSKRPAQGALVRLMPGIDPFFIHLVRDPRAQAYSWRRIKASPGHDGGEMQRYGPWTSTWDWITRNVAVEGFRWSPVRDRLLRLRYEDFILNPRSTIESVASLVGEPVDLSPLLAGNRVRLSPNHNIGGNPVRFSTGSVELKLDQEWVKAQNPIDRLIATSLSLPLLPRYGYRLRPKLEPVEATSEL